MQGVMDSSMVSTAFDKLRKYPHIFHEGEVVLVNKVDLLPYTHFSLDRFRRTLPRLTPLLRFIWSRDVPGRV